MLVCTYTADNNGLLSNFNTEILGCGRSCAAIVHEEVSLAFAIASRIFSKWKCHNLFGKLDHTLRESLLC